MICSILHSERVGFMLGTILFVVVGIVAVMYILWTMYFRDLWNYKMDPYRHTKPNSAWLGLAIGSSGLLLIVILGVWFISVLTPIQTHDGIYRYDEVRMEVSLIENSKVEPSMDVYRKVYEDIAGYNDDLRYLQDHYGNAWNGAFIDDIVLTMEEIPMPEWQQKID